MNSIQKGSMTVVLSTVIASAAILMTGNSVANDNENQNKSVGAPVKSKMSVDVSAKESTASLSTTTPPPPSGPFLGDGGQAVSDAKKLSFTSTQTGSELSPPEIPSVSQNEPKAPSQPSAPSQPVSVGSARAPQPALLNPKAPVASDKAQIKAVQPVNDMASTTEKSAAPIAPTTPDSPVAKALEKPQTVANEIIKPSKPEKALDSFKPSAPEMEMTDKQSAPKLEVPKLGKAAQNPNVSLQSPNQDIAISKPQKQMKKPVAPIEAQAMKAPVMPNQAVDVQRPLQPQNMNQERPVMSGEMGNRVMPNQQNYRPNNQQANLRPPLWKEKMWQQKNYPPRSNDSANANKKGIPQPAQAGGQNRMMPPNGMYQYAPMYPSNYGYPQMPMWNNNGYYYQMMPYYWPVMPQNMPNINVQPPGANPPANVNNGVEGPSMNGKK